MIYMIWAMDQDWLIGRDNFLPWHYKEDLAFFKKVTHQKTVLMGEATYRSLKSYYKGKPLPFGKIYIANIKEVTYDDGICITDVVSFLKSFLDDLYVIGGRMIYSLALPYADILYVTHVLNRHEGNVYFPKFKLSQYHLVEKNVRPHLIFATYQRK